MRPTVLAAVIGAALVGGACGADSHDAADATAMADATAPADGGVADTLQVSHCDPSAALLARVDPARMLSDLTFLTGLGERGSHGAQTRAADYLRAELSQLAGVQVRDHGYTHAGQGYVNLEATIAGVEQPEQFIFAGAHYDSHSDDPALAPGADDNASGTVAVLETARAFAGCQPRRSVRLLFFSNEELGTVGSLAYVRSIKPTVPPAQLVGYINVDMIGYASAGEDLDLATRPAHRAFALDMAAAVEQWTPLGVKQHIDDHCG